MIIKTSEKQITKQTKRKAPKTAFKKGQSGNPAGRPKKTHAIADIINRLSEAKHKGNVTKIEALIASTYELAIAGDSAARNFIADRKEGKAVERVESGKPGQFKQVLKEKELEGKTAEQLIQDIEETLNTN